MGLFSYPKWAFVPGKKHATIYISDEQPADVVSYGVRFIHNMPKPIVKFTGFSAEDGAGALSIQRLGEAMRMIINHAARQCRLPVNHSGAMTKISKREVVEDGQKYEIVTIPVYMRASADKQKYIVIKFWRGGLAAHSAVVTVPEIVFWDIPTMAQFETLLFSVAAMIRNDRPPVE